MDVWTNKHDDTPKVHLVDICLWIYVCGYMFVDICLWIYVCGYMFVCIEETGACFQFSSVPFWIEEKKIAPQFVTVLQVLSGVDPGVVR